MSTAAAAEAICNSSSVRSVAFFILRPLKWPTAVVHHCGILNNKLQWLDTNLSRQEPEEEDPVPASSDEGL